MLTPANVGNLELLHAVPLDEQVDAQPLYVPGLKINEKKQNVVYVVTENNTVYAIDAATGAILMQQNLGPPVPRSELPGRCYNNSAVVGINSTPVIDHASNTLYVMTYTYTNNTPAYHLHALDLATLQDRVPPALVQATATLDDGSNWHFEPAHSRQRAALLEANGNIYSGFAGFCDFAGNRTRGWLLGWQAGSLTPLAANRLNNRLIPAQSPNDFFQSSIWMSGYGVAADAKGRLYFATGNSDPSGTTYNHTDNLSESVVKMSPDLTKVLGYFSPTGATTGVGYLDRVDGDLGSGGVLLLPPQSGSNLPLATVVGKDGFMYLLNRQDLGGHHDPNRVLGSYWPIGGCWCGESYFEGSDGIGRVVTSGWLQMIVWKLQTSPSPTLFKESLSPQLSSTAQDPGFFTSVSSNGTSNAIVWAVGRPRTRSAADVTLYVFDPQAAAQGNTGWLFSAAAGTWPNTQANANIVPVVANGRVYVASYKELAIFGLPSTSGAAMSGAPPQLASPARPPPMALPANGHEIFGTIKTVADDNIMLATRTGKQVRVEASDALHSHSSVVLLVGEPVAVFGSYDKSGALLATSVLHAKASPRGWPADR